MSAIDLDQNASSPLDPEVLEAMRPYWLAGGNPESRHAAGRAARRGLEQARSVVAQVLRAEPSEVVFTSGGTEANNLALFGLVRGAGTGHIVTSAIEHPAVAAPLERLESEGWSVTRAPVDRAGRVDIQVMAGALRSETRLATLMLANNEVGALQPVAELARLAAEHGALVHTDAVQAIGRVPVDFHALGATTLAASAHKFHGPGGVGALLVRQGARLAPLWVGGGQEGGRRPGTVPVALCVGMARALELWERSQHERHERWEGLRGRLANGLVAALAPGAVVVHGPERPGDRLPQTLNIGFRGVDGDSLLMQLDLAGVRASIGAACASGATRPSRTLEAMGVAKDCLRSSVRFSFGATTTAADIDAALRAIVAAVRRARDAVPAAGG